MRSLFRQWLAAWLTAAPLLGAAAPANAQDYPGPGTLLRRAANTTASDEPPPPEIQDLPDVRAQMKIIHRRSQLLVAKSNILRTAIADTTIVDVVQYSPNELSLIGLALGSTTVTLWFENGGEPLIYLVEVIRDPSLEERQRHDYGKLERKLAILFPNSKVYLIPVSGKIIVKGQARDSEEAHRILQIVRGEVINQAGSLPGPQPLPLPGVDPNLATAGNPLDQGSNMIVNMLDIPGEFQISLRVRIAELNRSMLRRMGVNLGFLINDGQNFFSTIMSGSNGLGSANGGSTSFGSVQGVFSSGDVRILMDALAANGTTRILAEPNITVLSGHPASFLSGGEFAVPTIVGIQGVGGQQTTFRGYGVSLVVTPTVLDRDIIRMQILPEFSQINLQNRVNGIFGTNVRRVSTTVELREGQTIALAGLLSHQTDVEVDRIPFLGEIPVIGGLIFNAKRAAQDEKELIILVSPELVRPMEPDEVPPLPGYEVTHPTDKELYCYARTEGAPDRTVSQLPPYGHGNGYGIEVGHTQFNPAPAQPGYHPAPTAPFGLPPAGAANPFSGAAPEGQQGLPPAGPGAGPLGRYPVAPNTRRASLPARPWTGNPTPPAPASGPGFAPPQGGFQSSGRYSVGPGYASPAVAPAYHSAAEPTSPYPVNHQAPPNGMQRGRYPDR